MVENSIIDTADYFLVLAVPKTAEGKYESGGKIFLNGSRESFPIHSILVELSVDEAPLVRINHRKVK